MFSKHLARLPPKPDLDAYTTSQILAVRAQWAIDEAKDVIASRDGANWTVGMDRDASLKEAVPVAHRFSHRGQFLARYHPAVESEGTDDRRCPGGP